MSANLIEFARQGSGLTQQAMADLAGTSRPTLSAYEHGRKSPTLETTKRLLRVAGYQITAEPLIDFTEVTLTRGRPIYVPSALWRLSMKQSFSEITLPVSVNWSTPGKTYDLSDRRQRARCYEIILREGMPKDFLQFIDGALLTDLWNDLIIPKAVRNAWQHLIGAA